MSRAVKMNRAVKASWTARTIEALKMKWALKWWNDLGKNTRAWIVIGMLGAVAISGGVYGYFVYQDKREVDELTQMAKEAFQNPGNSTMSREERHQRFVEFREKMDQLTDEQKQQVRENLAAAMHDRQMKPIREFFMLKSQDDRNAHLDKIIMAEEKRRAEFEQRRKQWEQQRAQNPNANNGQQRGNRGPGGPSGPGNRGAGSGNRGSGNASNGNNRGPRGPRTQESRDNRRRSYLDHTSPKDRAMRAEYRQALKQRREQLGLPEPSRRWRR